MGKRMKIPTTNKIITFLQNFLEIAFVVFACLLFFVVVYFKDCLVSVLGFEFDIVQSYSMKGTLEKYDFLVVMAVDAKKIEEGDIVVFFDQSHTHKIVHRVVQVVEGEDGKKFVTKGDNNDLADVGMRQEQDIYGRFAFKVPTLGLLITFLCSQQGILVLMVNVWNFILIHYLWKLEHTPVLPDDFRIKKK